METPLYLKIETNDKKKIASFIEDAIEATVGHMVFVKKLDNGNYRAEIIEQSEEPKTT